MRKQLTTVDLHYIVYDILFLNGRSLLQSPWLERRRCLEEVLSVASPKVLSIASTSPVVSWDKQAHLVDEWLDKSLEAGCEGLMVKCCDDESTYEPNVRSNKWLKLKKDYVDSIGDTLDLVVLGAWMGKGKRASLFGTFLVGCYNEDTEEFESLARIGTGLTDDDLVSI